MTDGTVMIRGKQYKIVAKRVEEFWQNRDPKDWSITTSVLDRDDKSVLMVAEIRLGDRVVATGHAEESRSASQINETSAIENCETSAIGRALAALGYAGGEFCSADELLNALKQQSQTRASGNDTGSAPQGAPSSQRGQYDEKSCPRCGRTGAVRKDTRGGTGTYYCWKKLGGCGAKEIEYEEFSQERQPGDETDLDREISEAFGANSAN